MTKYKDVQFDPVINMMRRAMEVAGETPSSISRKTGISVGCIAAWFSGKTKRPQNVTVRFFLRACGYRQAFLNDAGDELTARGHNVVTTYREGRRVN